MSKVYLDFETYKAICLAIADKLKEENLDEIVAIHRGGMVAASIIGKHLKLPVGSYFPKTNALNLVNPEAKRIAFIEDLVAKGRTLQLVADFVKAHPEFQCAYFVPVLVDGAFEEEFKFYGIKTNHWIVMPFEEFDAMNEGDRGLFRDGSDSYGKK